MTATDTHRPVVDIDLSELIADPYPTLAHLRREAPVAYVPAAGRYLVTREADVVAVDRNPEIYSSMEPDSSMHRVMGDTVLRKMVRPIGANEPAELAGTGEAELFTDLAAPLAARNLAAFLGLPDTAGHHLVRWSQDLGLADRHVPPTRATSLAS